MIREKIQLLAENTLYRLWFWHEGCSRTLQPIGHSRRVVAEGRVVWHILEQLDDAIFGQFSIFNQYREASIARQLMVRMISYAKRYPYLIYTRVAQHLLHSFFPKLNIGIG